jgi:hypothetical protein
MGTYDRADKSKRGGIVVHVTDDGNPVTGASVSLFRAPEALTNCDDFHPTRWKPAASDYLATLATLHDADQPGVGTVTFDSLEPGLYVLQYEHQPEQKAQCIEVKPRCFSNACFDLELGVYMDIKYMTDDCRDLPCAIPRIGDQEQVRLSWKDTKIDRSPFTLVPPADAIETSNQTFVRPVTSAGPNSSNWLVTLPARGPLPSGAPAPPPATRLLTNSFVAAPRSAQNIVGNMGVSLQRTATPLTADVSHWGAILNITDAMSFNQYNRFMEMIFCGERDLSDLPPFERDRFVAKEALGRRLLTRRALPFVDTDAYRFVKVATEAFVMVNCGVIAAQQAPFFAPRDSGYFARRDVPFPSNGLNALFTNDYLTRVSGGSLGALTLPYLAVIRRKLGDIDINVGGFEFSAQQASECYGILQEKLTNPCLLELIWSYWHEEGMLVQTTNAITRRFQNVRGSAAQDPLANLEVDPLRPLNNLLWGYVQDEQHRLSVVRRNYEYDHQYGLRLDGRAVQGMSPADSRSKFLEAFHNLLRLCTTFFKQDDDTTIKADAFPVLNALKEVHLILTEGQHNQFGDLVSTARIEMLMQEWLLARPEFREFLPTRISVAYPEPWMDRVDAMKKLQGWSDTSVLHFRNLGLFGEQILLGIRWGFWSDVQEPEQAFNWARLFRPQIQGYIHAYRAVAGVDLAAETVDTQVDSTMPSTLLKRRLAAQTQRGA